MKRIRLYIADVDDSFSLNVRRAASIDHGIEIIGTAASGLRALREIRMLQPDVLLTDIQLPEIDGISLIRECHRLPAPPVCVVCTRFYSSACMAYAAKQGADLFLYKPVDCRRLIGMIRECHEALRTAFLESEAFQRRDDQLRTIAAALRAELTRLGIPPRLDGSRYLIEAVLCLRSDRMLIRNLSSGLYKAVARRTNATPSRVERCLRVAIAIGYEHGSLQRYFNCRPTNREFIEFLYRRTEDLPAADACAPSLPPIIT